MKRQSLTTQGKPVLDEGTFHQLLAAAFTLQQHSDRLLVKEPKADCAQILSDGAIAENVRSIHVVPLSPETVAHPVPPLEPHPTPTHLARLPYRYRILGRRSSLRDDLFWKAAIVVAVAAVSALPSQGPFSATAFISNLVIERSRRRLPRETRFRTAGGRPWGAFSFPRPALVFVERLGGAGGASTTLNNLGTTEINAPKKP